MEDIALTPFAHTSGLYFNDKPEPQDKEFMIYKDLREESKEDGNIVSRIGKDDEDSLSYYDAKFLLRKNAHDNFKIELNRDPDMTYIKFIGDDDRMI